MRKKKALLRGDNRGLSLVELLVSIAMLAIIAVPLLSYFSSAAGYNARAKLRQTAVELAQSMSEQAKANSLEEIAGWFHSTNAAALGNAWLVSPAKLAGPDSVREVKLTTEADGTRRAEPIGTKGVDGSYNAATHTFKNSTNGMLYYAIYDINQNGFHYDALVTFDTNQQAGDSYFAQNAALLTDIKAIQSPENVAAVENTQLDMAVNHMYSLHMEAYTAQMEAHNSQPAVVAMPTLLTEAEIRASLVRNMVIELTADASSADRARVRIYYEYYCKTGILGCPGEAAPIEAYPPLYQENVALSELKNIYLFFNRCNADVENVEMNVAQSLDYTAGNLNLYLICQADASGTVPSPNIHLDLRDTFSKLEHIYSNGTVTRNLVAAAIQEPYITSSAKLRLMNVKVEVYRAGNLLNPDDLCAELESTKGE